MRHRIVTFVVLLAALFASTYSITAQQTLSSINGVVTDASGAAISGGQVTVKEESTALTRRTMTLKNGYFQVLDLPIGTYTVRVEHDGFDSTVLPHIAVVQSRASTVTAKLQVGQVTTAVTVNENPLMNATDTTNGFTLNHDQIQQIPLPTGSYTNLAALTPGVSEQLNSGVGTNAGLGNQAIWANGQRDTSNSFQVDGVDVTNLFNGKTASQDASQRYAFNIGQGSSLGGQSQTNTSVYGSNGNGLATPPPEMIQEMSVQTSMYDAQSGTNSGAHIAISTAAGTNQYHGMLYGTHATNAFNAAPFFFKQDADYLPNGAVNPTGTVPNSLVNPELHKELIGASVSGPVVNDKLFFFAGYQFMHDSDQFKGFSTLTVPIGLTNDRSVAGLQNAYNSYALASACYTASTTTTNVPNTAAGHAACYGAPSSFTGFAPPAAYTGAIDPVAQALFNATLPNGQFLIPSVQNTNPTALFSGAGNVFLPGSSVFDTNMAVGDLDYDVTKKDRLSAKYFWQHAPNTSPYTIANTGGFPEIEDSGAHVAALSNSILIGSKISWQQLFGFSRQKVYTYFQPAITSNLGIGFPSGSLPGLTLSKFPYSGGGSVTSGPNSAFVDAGYFQNRWNPSTNLFYTVGKHSLAFGSSFNYTQLNIRNDRGGQGTLTTTNLETLLTGSVSKSTYLTGNANRYYRTKESGSYVQDKWQVLPNLSITAGIRYDLNGPFSEKYGNLFNFNPSLYSVTASSVTNAGFVVAGNNAYCKSGTAVNCVSNSTLTGRQWGIGPRLGFAYSPTRDSGKVVFSGGVGFYYDRGELFSYLSQPAGSSTGGPFGVTEAPPLVDYVTGAGTKTLENPLGTTTIPAASSNPNAFTAQLPTANQIRSTCTAQENQSAGSCAVVPLNFGAYNTANKLPYSINYTFKVQWQPRNDLVFAMAYVGNVGRHGVIPLPFNEPGVATPTSPINGETSSYGYQVLNSASPIPGTKYYNSISTEPYNTYDGGNIDLRVPYVGYSDNAALFTAAGVSAYNALQTQVTKQTSHHTQAIVSYTWSHTLDEQSDLGLFFTGDNPDHLRDSYASADFDQTNTLTAAFVFTSPDLAPKNSLLGRFANDWQLSGIGTVESGEPYSLYEYDGAVGSLYFGNYPTLANPVLGIKNGSNPKSALTGHVGAFQDAAGGYYGAINVTQLQQANLSPGQKGIPSCTGNEPCDYFETDFTPGQRNIFRQSLQKSLNISVTKTVSIHERYSAAYSFNVFNVTNTPSFDVPNNSASIGQSYVGSSSAYGQVLTSQGSEVSTTLPALYKQPVTNSDGSTASTFGAIRNTIGSSRIIEMQLHLNF
jgi:hypothetical protein